jgi:hypothetical protein
VDLVLRDAGLLAVAAGLLVFRALHGRRGAAQT